MQSVEAARAIYKTPIPVHTYTPSDFQQKSEDPGLLATLTGFGHVEESALDVDGLDAAFGIASLGDSPPASGGRVVPFPGVSS